MPPVAVGAAQSYIEGLFGGPTEEVDKELSVGTSVMRALDNDPERLGAVFINLGTSNVYAMIDDGVTTTRGIIVFSGGGALTLNVRDDQTLPTRNWYLVSESGTNSVLVIATRRFALTGVP